MNKIKKNKENAITKWLLENGKSKKWLMRETGISWTTINKVIDQGSPNTKVWVVDKICRVTGLNMYQFINFSIATVEEY